MSQSTPLIYLLSQGIISVPLSMNDVREMVEFDGLKKDTLSRIDGMKEWRALAETMVWASGTLLGPIKPKVSEIVQKMADNKLDVRYGRVQIRDALQRENLMIDSETTDLLGIILEVNTFLFRNHKFCLEGRDYWDDVSVDLYPAIELKALGGQRFPRDWQSAWQLFGGRLFEGRMIACKGDSVWEAISDFGFPFPPFSMDMGMWIRQVTAKESEVLGLKTPMKFKPPTNIRPFDLVGIL